jgi:transposase
VQEKLLRSAKSVGLITAATLLAELPELGKLDRKKIAALAACRRSKHFNNLENSMRLDGSFFTQIGLKMRHSWANFSCSV